MEKTMPVLLRFTASGLTAEKYDETVRLLEEAGQGSPAGRTFHVCWGPKDDLSVSDIWETKEAFEAFAQTLKPIMDKLGVMGETQFIEIYNIIEGTKAAATAT
jgi:hypothetical protein